MKDTKVHEGRLVHFPSCNFVSLVVHHFGWGTSAESPIAMKRWNTSFDSSRPRRVSRITSPSRSSSPHATQSRIVPKNIWTEDSPRSTATFFRSTPWIRRNPKKKLSSTAAADETGLLLSGAPATYSSSESGEANLTASLVRWEQGSIECGSPQIPGRAGASSI